MRLIKTSDKLPELKEDQINQKLDKKKLSDLAEKVRKILKKERRLTVDYDEDISLRRGAFACQK
ncbi:MAG TPA: hypothetical protein VMW29_00170 [Candidatus Bathyarchaeia archaeon]|nr:hypothetical protein [Candidatus Bathyarchaeia archaeon]